MKSTRILVVAAAAALTLGAAASSLKKLPADYPLPQGKESPGVVTFRHATHVDPAKPDCTTCHPRDFKINEYGKTADGAPLTHERFDKGQQCGTCHGQKDKILWTGKATFGLTRCDRCHVEPEEEEEE